MIRFYTYTVITADDARIFDVLTVMVSKASVFAVCYVVFISITLNVIESNGTSALTKVSGSWGLESWSKAQHSAKNVGIGYIPRVVTNSPPCPVVPDFNSAFSLMTSTNETGFHSLLGYGTKNMFIIFQEYFNKLPKYLYIHISLLRFIAKEIN